MLAAGDGQDLWTEVKDWSYSRANGRFEIKFDVFWNGVVFRNNNYQVSGILQVNKDGTNPKFIRRGANYNFKKLESNMMWLGGMTAGVLMLNELSTQ